ncbi:hypothetical protein M501DRAFT_989919 [Patellaria atrata CBS 101060]|uniref:Uncharacterized protein n=1 Tax=Patellaria atrata CBS 101060 TaxID=1346257 RepID=A0A9P4SF58_9PEZI|nr:hypothetical protein M501DRAFT_989919 [Patellaria atrata CBS 101060]
MPKLALLAGLFTIAHSYAQVVTQMVLPGSPEEDNRPISISILGTQGSTTTFRIACDPDQEPGCELSPAVTYALPYIRATYVVPVETEGINSVTEYIEWSISGSVAAVTLSCDGCPGTEVATTSFDSVVTQDVTIVNGPVNTGSADLTDSPSATRRTTAAPTMPGSTAVETETVETVISESTAVESGVSTDSAITTVLTSETQTSAEENPTSTGGASAFSHSIGGIFVGDVVDDRSYSFIAVEGSLDMGLKKKLN